MSGFDRAPTTCIVQRTLSVVQDNSNLSHYWKQFTPLTDQIDHDISIYLQ